jgi:hypothetical protein
MKNRYIKNFIASKACKGLSKHRTKNNRTITKTMKEKYKEGIKAFKESLKDYRDYNGLSKDSLIKYKEKYKKAFNKYPSKNMSIIDIKRVLKEI